MPHAHLTPILRPHNHSAAPATYAHDIASTTYAFFLKSASLTAVTVAGNRKKMPRSAKPDTTVQKAIGFALHADRR
ncbi:hypothetical protein [Stenotrophomonas terrae]|uniref:hypothetical protein n=1 Tax=Stenotrophomonas terrae TaxID=405446 RepID=UPI0013A07DC5|nr:hypothetical protein [Stenotrophomonas terrae]